VLCHSIDRNRQAAGRAVIPHPGSQGSRRRLTVRAKSIVRPSGVPVSLSRQHVTSSVLKSRH
jgi:hypothetical protein